jgi:hypothetical protein
VSMLVLLLTATLTVLAAIGRPALTFSVLVGTWLLLPATLLVPHSPSAILTCSRLIELGALVGVVARRRRQAPPSESRWPLALPLLLAFLVTIAVTGVGMADPLTDPVAAAYGWVGQAEQALVLVLVIVLCRRLDPTRVLVVLAAGAAAAALVGLAEAATHQSWARLLFHASPSQLATTPAGPLERRSGGLRVRGAADFALAYGWVLAALLPCVVLLLPALRRRLPRLAPVLPVLGLPLVAGAIVLSHSRSSLVGAAVVVVLLLLLMAPRGAGGRLALLVVAVAAALAVAPPLVRAVSPSVDAGSIDVRVQRLPDVLGLAAQRPLQGAGITSIGRLGFGGVDSAYVLTYVETGVIALVLLGAALTAAVLTSCRGLRGERDDPDRRLVIAAALGMVSLLAGALTFDTFTVLMAEHVFWLLAGLGAVAAERLRGPEPLPPLRQLLSLTSALTIGVAVGCGLVLRTVFPEHTATEVVFSTMSPAVEVRDDPHGLGRTLVTTVCQVAREVVRPGKPWTISSCSEMDPPGWGRLRVQGPAADVTVRAAEEIAGAAHAVPGLAAAHLSPTAVSPQPGLPTFVRVAPEVLGLGTALLLLVPWRRRADR